MTGDKIEQGDGLLLGLTGSFQCKLEGRVCDDIIDGHCECWIPNCSRAWRCSFKSREAHKAVDRPLASVA